MLRNNTANFALQAKIKRNWGNPEAKRNFYPLRTKKKGKVAKFLIGLLKINWDTNWDSLGDSDSNRYSAGEVLKRRAGTIESR